MAWLGCAITYHVGRMYSGFKRPNRKWHVIALHWVNHEAKVLQRTKQTTETSCQWLYAMDVLHSHPIVDGAG